MSTAMKTLLEREYFTVPQIIKSSYLSKKEDVSREIYNVLWKDGYSHRIEKRAWGGPTPLEIYIRRQIEEDNRRSREREEERRKKR